MPHARENVQLHPDRMDQPIRWKKPRRIFVNSMSDVFHDQVPDAFIDTMFAVMALASQHTFQILTKRPQRMHAYLTNPETAHRIAAEVLQPARTPGEGELSMGIDSRAMWPLPNVWLGVSVEDQRRADERIPPLLETPAALRFLSCEPLLGPVDLADYLPKPLFVCQRCGWECDGGDRDRYGLHAYCGGTLDENGATDEGVDWVIAGAESGPQARLMDDNWVRTLRDQCRAAGTAFFFKQRVDAAGHKDIQPLLDGQLWQTVPTRGWLTL